ncbi:MAG: phosphate acetyltransferase [Candidatus Westeberhardia cardiocondylae]|nr:phosphate acetyltransferase [Candidatus Westeberhardia cardiocondylae]
MFISYGVKVGLTSIIASIVNYFVKDNIKVGVFKPISRFLFNRRYECEYLSESTTYIMKNYYPNVNYLKLFDIDHVDFFVRMNKKNILMEEILFNFYSVFKEEDIVLVEGLSQSYIRYPFFSDLNYNIANILNAEIVYVISEYENVFYDFNRYIKLINSNYLNCVIKNVFGIILNKIGSPKEDYEYFISNIFNISKRFDKSLRLESSSSVFKKISLPILGCIPWNIDLLSVRVIDVIRFFDINTILGEECYNRRINSCVLCGNDISNFLNYCNLGSLLILSCNIVNVLVIVYFIFVNNVKVSAVLLTDCYKNGKVFIDKFNINFFKKIKFPLLFVNYGFEEVVLMLRNFNLQMFWDDEIRVKKICNHIINYIDNNWLISLKNVNVNIKKIFSLSPSLFCYRLLELSRKYKKRIVFPEGNDPRIIEAVSICADKKIAHCVLLGDIDNIRKIANLYGIVLHKDVEIINPILLRENYVFRLLNLRKHRGMTELLARKQLEDNVMFGTLMLENNEVDGLVSGVVNTTANTIRPALQIIKTLPNVSLVSSVFFMLFPDYVLVYGDCAVNVNPTAEQLAEIAIQSSDTARLFGISPIVAMMSYATGTSGFGSDVEKIKKATLLVKEKRPLLNIDGPIQYDAAISRDVAILKSPNSLVAGRANVFIFPDLNSGNITYKAVQRSVNLLSIGPILQGIRKPVNDLSRGASVDDIVYTVAVTNIQAQ